MQHYRYDLFVCQITCLQLALAITYNNSVELETSSVKRWFSFFHPYGFIKVINLTNYPA